MALQRPLTPVPTNFSHLEQELAHAFDACVFDTEQIVDDDEPKDSASPTEAAPQAFPFAATDEPLSFVNPPYAPPDPDVPVTSAFTQHIEDDANGMGQRRVRASCYIAFLPPPLNTQRFTIMITDRVTPQQLTIAFIKNVVLRPAVPLVPFDLATLSHPRHPQLGFPSVADAFRLYASSEEPGVVDATFTNGQFIKSDPIIVSRTCDMYIIGWAPAWAPPVAVPPTCAHCDVAISVRIGNRVCSMSLPADTIVGNLRKEIPRRLNLRTSGNVRVAVHEPSIVDPNTGLPPHGFVSPPNTVIDVVPGDRGGITDRTLHTLVRVVGISTVEVFGVVPDESDDDTDADDARQQELLSLNEDAMSRPKSYDVTRVGKSGRRIRRVITLSMDNVTLRDRDTGEGVRMLFGGRLQRPAAETTYAIADIAAVRQEADLAVVVLEWRAGRKDRLEFGSRQEMGDFVTRLEHIRRVAGSATLRAGARPKGQK